MRSPAYVIRYLARLARGQAEYPVGHNPVGAVAILLLLLLGIASGVSGWAVYEEIGGDWLEALHEYTSNTLLAVVFAHIAGVLVSSYPLIALLLLTALIGFLIWAWLDSKG